MDIESEKTITWVGSWFLWVLRPFPLVSTICRYASHSICITARGCRSTGHSSSYILRCFRHCNNQVLGQRLRLLLQLLHVRVSLADHAAFCFRLMLSRTRYQTPFPDLSEVATLAACKCINSQNAVPSTPKALPAASGPACSSKNSDYVAITKDFTSAAAFCRFYLTNAA